MPDPKHSPARAASPYALSSLDKTPEPAEQRFTLMWIPEGGHSTIRQQTLTLRQLRWVLIGGVVVLAMAALSVLQLVAHLRGSVTANALVEENIALKSQLRQIEGTLEQVEEQLKLLKLYEAQLEGLSEEDIPGFGPLEQEEISARAWGGLTALERMGALGDPMDELDPMYGDLGPLSWAADIAMHSRRVLEQAAMIELELGALAESAEHWRARRSTVPSIWPVKGRLTSGFGYRRSPFTERWKFHSGIDVSAPPGTQIIAPGPGQVIMARWNSGYGKMVQIDHGYGVVSRFAHASRIFVREGQEVSRGDVIASVGSTGQVTGPHLHFEIYVDDVPVDPMEYLE